MPTDSLEKDKLNLHGTLTIQLMLEFNKPIKIVNSILNMDGNELKNLFLNTMGSHIVDSFVTSAFVGEKSREKLVRKMKVSSMFIKNLFLGKIVKEIEVVSLKLLDGAKRKAVPTNF